MPRVVGAGVVGCGVGVVGFVDCVVSGPFVVFGGRVDPSVVLGGRVVPPVVPSVVLGGRVVPPVVAPVVAPVVGCGVGFVLGSVVVIGAIIELMELIN